MKRGRGEKAAEKVSPEEAPRPRRQIKKTAKVLEAEEEARRVQKEKEKRKKKNFSSGKFESQNSEKIKSKQKDLKSQDKILVSKGKISGDSNTKKKNTKMSSTDIGKEEEDEKFNKTKKQRVTKEVANSKQNKALQNKRKKDSSPKGDVAENNEGTKSSFGRKKSNRDSSKEAGNADKVREKNKKKGVRTSFTEGSGKDEDEVCLKEKVSSLPENRRKMIRASSKETEGTEEVEYKGRKRGKNLSKECSSSNICENEAEEKRRTRSSSQGSSSGKKNGNIIKAKDRDKERKTESSSKKAFTKKDKDELSKQDENRERRTRASSSKKSKNEVERNNRKASSKRAKKTGDMSITQKKTGVNSKPDESNCLKENVDKGSSVCRKRELSSDSGKSVAKRKKSSNLKKSEILDLLAQEEDDDEEDEARDEKKENEGEKSIETQEKKRVPIYANAASTWMTNVPKNKDIYDPRAYGPEIAGGDGETDDDDEEYGVKKKRKKKQQRRRGPQKKKAGIILTFGRETKAKTVTSRKQQHDFEPLEIDSITEKDFNDHHDDDGHEGVQSVPPQAVGNKTSFSKTEVNLTSPNKTSFNKAENNSNPSNRNSVSENNPEASISFKNFRSRSKTVVSETATSFKDTTLEVNQDRSKREVPNENRSGKVYKTPSIPKYVSRMTGKISTPRVEEPARLTIKDEIKTCFGFLSDEDNDTEDDGSLVGGISPIVKVKERKSPVFKTPRQSSFGGNLAKPLHQEQQQQNLERPRPTRWGPPLIIRKENVRPPQRELSKDHHSPALSNVNKKVNTTLLFEDPLEDKNQSCKSKVTNDNKKQTLIYEEHSSPEHGTKVKRLKTSKYEKKEDVEVNGEENEMVLKAPSNSSNTSVSKVYKKRNLLNVPAEPKRSKKQEKKLDAWASLQTSHFSEVEEFHLSFA